MDSSLYTDEKKVIDYKKTMFTHLSDYERMKWW